MTDENCTVRWFVTAFLVPLVLVAGCSSSDPFEEAAVSTYFAEVLDSGTATISIPASEKAEHDIDPGTTTTPIPASQQAENDIDPGTTTTPISASQQAENDIDPGTTITPIPASAPTARSRTTATTRAGDVGTSVSGPALVPDVLKAIPPSDCRSPLAEAGCTAPGGVAAQLPRAEISIGEYQVGVIIPPGRRLNVYFDPARTLDDMKSRCYNMGGDLTRRGDDGSRWAGWWFCSDVDY